MTVQMELPLIDLQVKKDEEAKAAFELACREDRITTMKVFASVAGMFSVFFALAAYERHITQPISQGDVELWNNGRVILNRVSPCMYEYNFEAGERRISCAFPRRGAFSFTTKFLDMRPSEKAIADRVQKDACNLAAGRPGYVRACHKI